MEIDKEKLWSELESMGEDEVMLSIAHNRYNQAKLALVYEWLRRQESSRNESSRIEQRRIARSAKNAAWTAAIAAIMAAVCAIVALVI